MFSPRPRHERYDLYTTAMIQIATLGNPLARYSASAPLLGLFLVCNAVAVAGTPIQSGESISKRADGERTQGMTPKIWVPVVVAAIIIFVLTLLVWSKTSWRRSLRLFSLSGSATVGGPVGGAANTGPRELTAEQLAGTINGDVPAGDGGAAARTARRPRRPRRTPSQMSVTSLPAYNKEPGEEELVIFRGRDAEDATMPAAVAMTSLDEERDESAFSHDNAEERYSPMPTSPHDMPLLHDDTLHGDLSLQSLPNVTPGEDGARLSADAGSQSSHETSSLMRTTSNLPDGLPDPRGNAPAYYEVVDPNEIRNNVTDTRVARQPSTASRASRRAVSPPELNHTPGRRSGFRTLLNRMSMSSHHHAHNRNESVNSTFSSNISHGAEPSNGNTGTSLSNHRTTPSGSGSLLSVNMFRTISRQRSNHTLNSNRLNSPSLISLNSISAPLTHTVTRSEFTYPKSGPTAEQLKVISSRESFARFGVPYGADAIAYASSSRLDLVPPPDFESSVEALVSPRSAGPSRLRAASNARRISDGAATTSSSGDNNELGMFTNTANNDPTSPSISSPLEPAPAHPSGFDPVAASVAAAVQSIPSSSISKIHNSISGQAQAIPDAEKIVHDVNTAKSGTASSSKLAVSTPAPATQPISEFGKLSVPPPSSYHELTASSVRSESRASVFTFATAQESLTGRARAGSVTDAEEYFTDADAGAEESEFGSAPSTPRLGGQHALELTDATIVPDSTKRDTIVASSTAGTSGSSTAHA